MSDILKNMSGLYSNLKVNPSRKSGTLTLDKRYGLRVDEDQKPDEWLIFDSQSGDFTEQSTVPQHAVLIESFVDDWNKLSGYPAKDPLDNLKAGGFELSGSHEKIDEEELKTSEEEEKKITEMERREKEAEAEQVTDEDKLAKLSAIMDGEAEPVKSNDVKAHPTKETKNVHKISAMIPADIRSKQIIDLTPDDIINFLCPKATTQDAMMFLKLCQARGINPFIREAYLIKYKLDEPAQMVVSKDFFARKAEEHPQYDGDVSGIIIKKENGELEEREGTFLLPDEKLVGGWCNVFRKDRTRPIVAKVALHEYQQRKADGTLTKFWNEKNGKPATMIRKVALSQGRRDAFPGELSGLYDRSEIDGEIIEAEYQEVGE